MIPIGGMCYATASFVECECVCVWGGVDRCVCVGVGGCVGVGMWVCVCRLMCVHACIHVW